MMIGRFLELRNHKITKWIKGVGLTHTPGAGIRMLVAWTDCITSTAGNDAADRIVVFNLKDGCIALAKTAVQPAAEAEGLKSGVVQPGVSNLAS